MITWKEVVDERVDGIRGLSAEDRSDLRQDCYVALLAGKDRVERAGPGGLRKLIAKIVVEQHTLRTQRAWRTADDAGLETAAGRVENVPEDFESMMDGLLTDERAVLLALFVDGKTETEVAAAHGRSRWWVREKKTSGMGKIRRRMEGDNGG